MSMRLVRSGQRGIDHDIASDLPGALWCVALGLYVVFSLERAADVVFRVDDGPVVVDLDSLELREAAPAASGLRELDFRKIKANLGRVELIFLRYRNQRLGG